MAQQQFYAFVSSDDRIVGTPSRFQVRLNNTQFGMDRSIRIGLDELSLMHLQYPIRNTNNRFAFSEDNGATWLVTDLTPGDYDLATLATEIKNKMDTAGTNIYTVTIDSRTKRMTISTPLPGDIILNFTSALNSSSSAHKAFGYPAETITPLSSSHTSPMPVIIDADSVIYIRTNFLNFNCTSSSATGSSIFEMIPLNAQYGQILNYSSNNPNELVSTETRLSQMEIELINSDGQPYQLPENASVFMKFRIILDN